MPTTVEALIILFFFAVPAYLTIRIFKVRYPILYYRAKQSTLAEATLYAFLGAVVIIFTISFLVLLELLAIEWNLLPTAVVPALNVTDIPVGELLTNMADIPVGELLTNMADIPVGELLTAAIPLIIAYYVIGLLFSLLVSDIVPRILPKEPPPLWFEALFGVKRAKAPVWLLVHLQNRDRCLGLISEVRWIGDENCTMELTLEKTFYQLADSKEEKENIGRVLLRSDDILWLGFYSD